LLLKNLDVINFAPNSHLFTYSESYVDLLSTLLGVSFASGLNLYATVLAMGVLNRLGILHLPPNLDVIASTPVITVAAVLYGVEFAVDKVPFLDTFWDGLHTILRPAAGAFLAYGMVGQVDPKWQVLAALLGGSVALTSHAAKASTRAASHVSPEPFSKWILSLTEDLVAFVVVWLAGAHPVLGFSVVLLLAALAMTIVWQLSRLIRHVFRRAVKWSAA
jgi:hypothetical protein